jgi:8-oxo-dGTP pyrophosphatase MutT (NUDIX family)
VTVRQSTAAAALIRRTRPGGGVEWLTNWNEGWGALHLVGGGREPGESFRECCEREVAEELGLTPGVDFRVADARTAHLEYTAESRRAGVTTAYTIELFGVDLLSDAARAKIDADPECRWVTEAEVRALAAADGRAISPTTPHLLTLAGLLPSGAAAPGGAGQ